MSDILVRGARTHNLRGVDLRIARGSLTVLTGPSGSGKSSLAFDTLYAEAQRRYVESLQAHARQYLEQLPTADVEAIEGLSPAIALRQETPARNPRSTVGTTTDVHDFLRVLFARVGRLHCTTCGREVRATSIASMVEAALSYPEGTRLSIQAPRDPAPGGLVEEFARLRRDGFVRVIVDGALVELDAGPPPSAGPRGLDVQVDRVVVKSSARARIADSIELAARVGAGRVRLVPTEGEAQLLSERPVCVDDGTVMPIPTPRAFSWNAADGACPTCVGRGQVEVAAPARASDGGTSGRGGARGRGRRAAAPESDAPDDASVDAETRVCPACDGTRLSPFARAVTIDGWTIDGLEARPVREARAALRGLALAGRDAAIAAPLVAEIDARLGFLDDVGVGYLALARPTSTLSAGEAQRIRLATRLGHALVGVLYVLDEPSIGLHPRDTARLVGSLVALRDAGNTVLVVEHDLDVIRAADRVVDMGPGAGREGGLVVAEGTPAEIASCDASPTGAFLAGTRRLGRGRPRRGSPSAWIEIRGAQLHNLAAIDVRVPVGALTTVTGVSGAGKSSLVMGTLLTAARASILGARGPTTGATVLGLERFARVVAVDDRSMGRSPRSVPATYAGLLDPLRDLFASLPESRARGWDRARFSFLQKGGRCEACRGEGVTRVDLQFLPELALPCEACGGRRYEPETLEVRWRGRSIADVLDLAVDEARTLFEAVPQVSTRLDALASVGLGYLRLGQPSTTLSGGEAQRLLLARELARRGSGEALYVLDEPTTGLHLSDVDVLLGALEALVLGGHTVVLVEHAPELVAASDWVVDLGPEGGPEGGRLVVEGPPERVAACEASHTGRVLRDVLGARRR